MKTPVIIAAHNEADYLARTLEHLPRSIEPVVVSNASTDNTADIARSYGAQVIELDVQGKLPALQRAVSQLPAAAALEPILFTDADSRPAFPRVWPHVMTAALAPDLPSAATGPLGYIDGKLEDCLSNTYHIGRTAVGRWVRKHSFMTGNNMAVRFGSQQVLNEFLAMPHIWEGDDAAVAIMLSKNGGVARQLIDPRSLVLTSTRHAIKHQERKRQGIDKAWKDHLQRYRDRAAPGSRPLMVDSELGY
jgi:glycosyltransferase involved in cell wall biosynthesis